MINNDLLRDLAEDKVVLFLGAGVSASSLIDDRPAFKGWPEFLAGAAESRESALRDQVKRLIGAKDYLLACQLLQDSYEHEWQELITAEYGKVAQPSRLHDSTISLKQRLVVTTNFDKLLETAWANSISAGARSFKVISAVEEGVFRCLKDYDTPYLIKIHGSVDDTSSMVFSRSEYIKLAFANTRYSNFIDALLLNYTILFIGFSMEDPAISALMELYAFNYPGARPHYIMAPQGGGSNIAEINKRLRKLSMIEYDPVNNHEELPVMIAAMANAAKSKKREILAARILAAA
ncbi:SIR2 family protein [Ramlibacter alkalitolerans]|uniref:SIR2 family protein n=1 Tax=Ramlibacter alkalitolerans TaxID=2039631 RepID=A0ABS1JTG1_9BURK|nr:SIR2 family protein [Ramlibacter alkalitolerans]MBL0427461.1 SIR2 family protein [Ramlibacter alkalitolerans]